MGPQNGIVGDNANYGTDLPQTQPQGIDPEVINQAKFSQSKEFKSLKDKMQSRIEYYTQYQPGGGGNIALRDMSNEERGWRCLASDLIITELSAIIASYEMAAQEVKNETAKRKATEGV